MERMSDVVEISSETLEETNVSDPVSLAKEKNMSTVFEVVEISSETLEETTVSDPVTNPVHGLPSNCHQRSLFPLY